MKNKLTHILVVEDDPLDVANILRAFKTQGVENPVHVVTDGRAALEMLQHNQPEALQPVPRIILLDLNLPNISGLDLLKEIRNDERLKACSVFVMTASTAEKDMLDAYDLNVAGYIQKPIKYETFLEMVATLNSFWNLIELPN